MAIFSGSQCCFEFKTSKFAKCDILLHHNKKYKSSILQIFVLIVAK